MSDIAAVLPSTTDMIDKIHIAVRNVVGIPTDSYYAASIAERLRQAATYYDFVARSLATPTAQPSSDQPTCRES